MIKIIDKILDKLVRAIKWRGEVRSIVEFQAA